MPGMEGSLTGSEAGAWRWEPMALRRQACMAAYSRFWLAPRASALLFQHQQIAPVDVMLARR